MIHKIGELPELRVKLRKVVEVRPLTKDLRSSVTPKVSRSCSETEGCGGAVAAAAMAESWGGMEMVSEKDLI